MRPERPRRRTIGPRESGAIKLFQPTAHREFDHLRPTERHQFERVSALAYDAAKDEVGDAAAAEQALVQIAGGLEATGARIVAVGRRHRDEIGRVGQADE
jgi:hypothetical protein